MLLQISLNNILFAPSEENKHSRADINTTRYKGFRFSFLPSFKHKRVSDPSTNKKKFGQMLQYVI